jgi:D-alanyl-D-alanine dipeptidase
VPGPIDLSEVHIALDRLRPQLCHCGLKGECVGCKGIEMVRAQAEAVAAAASQPVLIQVAQEAALRDMTSRFQAMSERLMADPEIRRSAEQMQEKLMSDPETRQLLEELMRRLGGDAPPPSEELN